MQMPTVKTVLNDPKHNISYEVMAYRSLTEQEVIDAVRFFLASTPRSKRPKRGQIVTIVTTIS